MPLLLQQDFLKNNPCNLNFLGYPSPADIKAGIYFSLQPRHLWLSIIRLYCGYLFQIGTSHQHQLPVIKQHCLYISSLATSPPSVACHQTALRVLIILSLQHDKCLAVSGQWLMVSKLDHQSVNLCSHITNPQKRGH